MLALLNKLNGYKTYIVAAAGLVYAVVVDGWMNGNWNTTATLVLGSGGLASLRHALAKSSL